MTAELSSSADRRGIAARLTAWLATQLPEADAIRVDGIDREGMVEQMAAIHAVDLRATGLDQIDDGHAYLDREIDHWCGEMRRVRRAHLPALEGLVAALREHQPPQHPRITLVHGDPKPGNVAFDDRGEVSAVFDWEMATIGDPMADVGWVELMWALPGTFTALPGALTADEAVAY